MYNHPLDTPGQGDLVLPLSIDKLLNVVKHPYQVPIWVEEPLSLGRIRECLREGLLEHPQDWNGEIRWTCTLEQHHRRVAWLVEHGWEKPIDLDFGVVGFENPYSYPLIDGHHRLAAALYRESPSIDGACSGSISLIESYLWLPPELVEVKVNLDKTS